MGEEQVLDTEAVEMPELEGKPAEDAATRRLPATVDDRSELSLWRGEMRTAAIAAAGGLVAGAATVAAVRATRGSGGKRAVRRSSRAKERPVKVLASRSFLVDVHLLDNK
ncbi:MAG TPA: hypothetical protein VK326_02530 [Solirubrobacterales bacterium]|nr:hypothetical protein [Solirubrobacterales bacterium]